MFLHKTANAFDTEPYVEHSITFIKVVNKA